MLRKTDPSYFRMRFLLIIFLGISFSNISCVNTGELKNAMRAAIKEGMAAPENEKSVPKKEMNQDEERELANADSLLKLITQDVGIDPKKGSVQRAIWRVRVIELNIKTARQALDNSREEIFGIGATAEEIKALKEMDQSINSAAGDSKEELITERRQFQEESIKRSKSEGRLEKKKLGKDQAKRVGLLLFNLGVGVICDNLVIKHSSHVTHDFIEVKKDIFDRGGADAFLAGASVLKYRKDFLSLPERIAGILKEAPAQLVALGNMISTIKVLKQNNDIEEREPQAGDSFEKMEDF
jgi:hypothetical protein